AIEVIDLEKSFGDIDAVDGISFAVQPGETFGFLGPNGAGKTTTIRMLTGVLKPDTGSAHVAGADVQRDRKHARSAVGIVPEQFNGFADLTAWQNLQFAGELYGLSKKQRNQRATTLLEDFELADRRDALAKAYSKGMKQRLMLAMALIHDPAILILDEPITGLDVESQRLMRERIAALNEDGRTVLITTHNIEEADRLCDRVAIITGGTIRAIDRPEVLKRNYDASRAIDVSFDGAVPEEDLATLPAVKSLRRRGDTMRLHTGDPSATITGIAELSSQQGTAIRTLQTCEPSLEDVFTTVTGGCR
ncbi:MAG: ATP-binding cassette domain-containing protein, partial [Halorhabdus sp.]